VREANAIRFVRTQHNLKPRNNSTVDRDVGLTGFILIKKRLDVCVEVAGRIGGIVSAIHW